MNHSDPSISRIISSDNNLPPQRYSSLSHPEANTSSTHRKRPRDPKDEGDDDNDNDMVTTVTKENDCTSSDSNKITSNDMNDDIGNDSKDDDEKIVVRGLRLEAIFHPKFDNERNKKGSGKKGKGAGSSSDIRSTMLQKLGIGSGCAKVGSSIQHATSNDGGNPVEVGKGTGHLEVSLKHSGSLVLWSGSTRYYSKNSACNEFTRTTEILLRQQFETVREAVASSTTSRTSIDDDNKNQHCYRSYDDCSRFVSQHRYTIAFEVVTAEMLGDHGQIPHLDYVVVTAVADRNDERFLSTTEVLAFCHRFRLPHNDVWTFFPPTATTSKEGTDVPSSAETLFQMYDTSLREIGYTENTVQALTDIADVYIPSPIPHSVFQGSICEGFIVRYVDDVNDVPVKERQELEGLAQAARDILKEVPPTPAPGRAPDNLKGDPVLDADLRAIHQSIPYNDHDEHEKSHQKHKPSLSVVTLQRQRAALFSEGLKKLLQDVNESESNGDVNVNVNVNDNERQMKRPRQRRQRHDLEKIEKEKENNREEEDISATKIETKSTRSITNHHLPTLAKSLLESRDKETKRIATLLQTLDGLKGGSVTYTWMEKHDDEHDDSQRQNRLYCIIHVHNDSTFFKFQSLQSPSDMTLFRGFCVEVLLSSSVKKEEDKVYCGGEGGEEKGESPIKRGYKASKEDEQIWKPHSRPTVVCTTDGVSGTPLMLKMKLLPYMVRTFVCRNLLKTILQKGPEEFARIALGLLEKWRMSSEAQERWMPFFRGWALYVLQYEAEKEQREFQFQEQRKSAGDLSDTNDSKNHSTSIGDTLLELGLLTNFSYLRHLEHFTKLYENGKFRTVPSTTALSSPEFHTFVCVISQSTEVSSALANHFANYFNATESSKTDKMCTVESKMVVCSLGEATKNRRSKSCIAYANVGDLTKGIKKFICDKKVAKRSIFILFGSNKDEIVALTRSVADKPPDETRPPSWLEISSEGEGKKLVNMWKPWKKFPCAKRLELGRSAVELEPKKEGSTAAVIAGMNDTQEIIDAIQGVGRSLIEQEIKKQSDPSRGGILVFFPGIPGCGKSSLLESSRSKLEEEMGSRKLEKGDLYDRSIHVEEGDKIGKKFWNIIEDLLSDDNVEHGKSPALVIADKNAPPASWPKLGQIGHDSNGIMLPVLPDSSVLETTTIKGSIQPNGTLLPHASHFYPFSLKFLAVSLSRVLSRPPGEHVGKLDSGFPMACMVVVQFFSFYRYIGADTFQEKMNERFDKDGAFSIEILEPVQLPFLTASARDQALPDDLKNLLEEALQLRHGHDKNKEFKVKKEDAQMIELEERIRSSFERHKETIRTMTVNLEETKEAFAVQMMDRIKYLSNKPTLIDSAPEDDICKSVKLVSLDIDRIKVHELLQKYQESGALKIFFDSIESLSPSSLLPAPKTEDSDIAMPDANEVTSKIHDGDSEGITTARYPAPNFVENTHVTMSFAGENNSAEKLLSNFGHLQGREVTMSITGFLWSSTNAALAIKISSSAVGEDSVSIPPCENSFAHVTVWCAPDVKASLSNQLPNLVESGKASRLDFAKEDVLVGKVSFWNHKNEPFKV
jgi:hypothetical protein